MAPSPAPRITVIGLGPSDEGLVTLGTLRLIEASPVRFLRTRQHPAASLMGECASFDHLYDQLETFDAVYAEITRQLIEAAHTHGEILYAVPGSPVVAERTVEALIAQDSVEVRVIPALSFLDLTWTRLAIDPLAEGVRIVDAHRFDGDVAGERGPFLVTQCHSNDVLSDVKLAFDVTEPVEAVLLHHLGLNDECITQVSWENIDRTLDADHLTSLYIPRLKSSFASEFVRLEAVMRELRQNCPWDAEQTHQTLARYVIEEAYEVVEAIGRLDQSLDQSLGQSSDEDFEPTLGDGVERDLDEAVVEGAGAIQIGSDDEIDHLCEELGDLLFQVVFHACLATEEGWFTLADVAAGVSEKMIRRHPHVFDSVAVESSSDVARNWEAIKANERGGKKAEIADIDPALPSLMYASKVLKRMGEQSPKQDLSNSDQYPTRFTSSNELGEVLLGVVVAARSAGLDPETALRHAISRKVEIYWAKDHESI